jgi:hypothetical protein
MQLKKKFQEGMLDFAAHMKETVKDKVASIEDHPVLRDFEDAFREISGFPSKRDIELSIDLVPGAPSFSKAPYRMSTPELHKLQMQLEELLKKGYIRPSISPWGAPILFVKNKDGNLRFCIDF